MVLCTDLDWEQDIRMPLTMRKPGGMRLHLPMQFFTGAVARASRSSDWLMNKTVPRMPLDELSMSSNTARKVNVQKHV
jgi:hypothetical protein